MAKQGVNTKHTKDFFQHAADLLQNIIDHSELLTFIYYPASHRYQIINQAKKFSFLPTECDDFPAAFLPYLSLSAEDAATLKETVEAVNQGAEEKECTLKITVNGSTTWLNLHWQNYFAADKTPLYTLVYGIDVTSQKEHEKNFTIQTIYQQLIKAGTIIVMGFNVTEDRLFQQDSRKYSDDLWQTAPPCSPREEAEIYQLEPTSQNQRRETRYYFLKSAAQIPDKKDRERFINLSSRAGMLRNYQAGRTKETLKYERYINGKLCYVSTTVVLVTHPETKDLYAFFFTKDLTVQKQTELIIDTVLHQSCDFIAVMDAEKDTVNFRYLSDSAIKYFPHWQTSTDLNHTAEATNVLSRFYRDSDLAKKKVMVDLNNVSKELDKHGFYISSYSIPVEGDLLRKQLHFRWLDKRTKKLLLIQQDVTVSWKREQERSRKETENANILSNLAMAANDFVATINVNTSSVSLHSGSWYDNGIETPEDERNLSIRALFKKAVHYYLPSKEARREFWEAVNLPHVISELEKEKDYIIVRTFIDTKGKLHKKQYRWAWLDESKTTILYVRTDVTKSHEQELHLALDELILQKITLNTTDLVGLIDIENSTLKLVIGEWPVADNTAAPPQQTVPYEMAYNFYAEHCPTAASQELYRERFKLENIIQRMKENNEWQTIQEFKDMSVPGLIRQRRFRYLWLDEEKKLILCSCVDVTDAIEEEKKHNQRLHDALLAAEQSNAAKSQFLSQMSHDIRTPLNAIIGFSTLLLQNTNDADKVGDAAMKILSSSKHLLGLINDVLDMSKIESGTIEITPRQFCLSDTITNLNDIMQPLVKEKKQQFEIHIADLYYDSYIADDNRLQQALLNILSNATKYTQEGGKIILRIKGLQAASASFENIAFTIEDNGAGMSREYQRKLFTPFSREERKDTKHIQGTGLGLAITKNLVNMLNGTISVRSQIGEGSKFTLIFPLKIADKQAVSCRFEEYRHLRALVANKDREASFYIGRTLKRMGISYSCSYSAAALLSALKNNRKDEENLDFIILDSSLITSVSVLSSLRESAADKTRIILLTDYDFSLSAEIKKLIDGSLPKPFIYQKFKNILDNIASCSQTAGTAAETQTLPANILQDLHILAAEDNELNAEILVEIMKIYGAKVTVVPDGRQMLTAFKNCQAGDYALLLMDIQMPVMDGYEATKAIRSLAADTSLEESKRKEAKDIPIIAMTANAFNEDIQKSLLAGMNAHVSKPLNINVLCQTIQKYLTVK